METLQGKGGGRPYSEHPGTCPSLVTGEDLFHMPFLLQDPKSCSVERSPIYQASSSTVLYLTHWVEIP